MSEKQKPEDRKPVPPAKSAKDFDGMSNKELLSYGLQQRGKGRT